MLKYILLFVTFFLSFELFAQNDKLINDSKNFIFKQVKIFESNPIHKQNSEKIEKLFQSGVKNFPKCKLDTNLYFRLLLDNSITSYEDAQDAYRYSVRRCLIFSLFAMSLEEEQKCLFIDFAENSLFVQEKLIDENAADVYCGILILQLIIKDSAGILTDYDIKHIKEKYKKLDILLNKPEFIQGLQIIEKYEKKYNNK